MRIAFLIAVLGFLLSACKKDLVLPVEPSIELISIGPTDIEQFHDVVTLRFKYKDGDGDIGEEDADAPSLRVKDSRLAEPDWYHIQPIAPIGSSVPIEGEVSLNLNTLFLLGNGSQEETTFTIRLKDRAGNYSNELVSQTILIHDSL